MQTIMKQVEVNLETPNIVIKHPNTVNNVRLISEANAIKLLPTTAEKFLENVNNFNNDMNNQIKTEIAKREAAEKERKEAAQKAREAAEERAKKAAEEKQRQEAEALVKKLAAEKAKKDAEERTKKAEEAKVGVQTPEPAKVVNVTNIDVFDKIIIKDVPDKVKEAKYSGAKPIRVSTPKYKNIELNVDAKLKKQINVLPETKVETIVIDNKELPKPVPFNEKTRVAFVEQKEIKREEIKENRRSVVDITNKETDKDVLQLEEVEQQMIELRKSFEVNKTELEEYKAEQQRLLHESQTLNSRHMQIEKSNSKMMKELLALKEEIESKNKAMQNEIELTRVNNEKLKVLNQRKQFEIKKEDIKSESLEKVRKLLH